MPIIDRKDVKLIELLQENGRESLTNLAKGISLSIDSTHSRIKRLQEKGILKFGIFVDPKKLGYELVANVQIKLHNVSDEEMQLFIKFLISHKNVIELITTLGDFDVTCIIIAKNTEEFETISRFIRHKFKNIIADWKSIINLKVYKFEEYAVSQLL